MNYEDKDMRRKALQDLIDDMKMRETLKLQGQSEEMPMSEDKMLMEDMSGSQISDQEMELAQAEPSPSPSPSPDQEEPLPESDVFGFGKGMNEQNNRKKMLDDLFKNQ